MPAHKNSSIKYIAALIVMAGVLFLFRAEAGAHPHCYVLNSVHFVFNADGLDRLQFEWQFDEIFSSQIIADCDLDGDPSLSEREKACIRAQYFEELKTYDYFTAIKVNGRSLGTPIVLDPRIAVVEGQMMIQFTVPLAVPAGDDAARVRVALYDPTYYCAMTFPDQLPVFLENDGHLNTRVVIRENLDVSYYYFQVHPWEAELTFCRPPCDPDTTGDAYAGGGDGLAGDGTDGLSLKARLWRVQNRLYGRIGELAKAVKGGDAGNSMFLLLGAAFLYGLVHAAGPGHGKAFAASYVLAKGPNLKRSLLFGNMVAFLHGASAVTLVVLIHTAVLAFSGASMDRVEYATKAVSYGLISLMGLYLFTTSIWGHANRNEEAHGRGIGGFGAMAVSIGLVPCPGVALVLLFAMSLGMLQTGLLMVLCQVLGMAVTISAVTILAALGRRGVFGVTGKNETIFRKVEFALEILSGLGVFVLGLALLFGTVM